MFKYLLNILICLNVAAYGYGQQIMNGFNLENLKIPRTEIKQGGPPKDGIPSIDRPRFLVADKADFLTSDQKILGVIYKGISKAYPISILNWHEVVNDTFNGHPVVITYCPLCGSGAAFDALIDHKATTFGVSGLLYNSDVLLYDRQTQSLWSQIKMQAVSGGQSGKPLKLINTERTTWQAWKKDHPESLVLSEQTGFNRDYRRSPYSSYELSDHIMFPVNNTSSELANKDFVIGVNINDKYKAYPLRILQKQKNTIVDQIGGQRITVKYNELGQSASVLDQNGRIIPSIQLYWFAWYAFHPNTEIYKR